jgi:hypothetical protein
MRLARCVINEGWPLRRAAERLQISPITTGPHRWVAAADHWGA